MTQRELGLALLELFEDEIAEMTAIEINANGFSLEWVYHKGDQMFHNLTVDFNNNRFFGDNADGFTCDVIRMLEMQFKIDCAGFWIL